MKRKMWLMIVGQYFCLGVFLGLIFSNSSWPYSWGVLSGIFGLLGLIFNITEEAK